MWSCTELQVVLSWIRIRICHIYPFIQSIPVPLSYLSSHSFSLRELHSCTVLVLCCSSRASLSSSGAWTKRFSKSWTSSSKLYIWRTGMDWRTEEKKGHTDGSAVWLNVRSTCTVVLGLPSPRCRGSVASYSKPASLFSPGGGQTQSGKLQKNTSSSWLSAEGIKQEISRKSRAK